MLYLVTALYEEALLFIKKYNLKQKTDFPHFELFAGEEVLLLVTRPGALRAAAALSSVLTAFPPGKDDLLLSVGCAGCASENMIGKAFLICRITEEASGRTRYPELLYRCPFPEAEVITQAHIRFEPDSESPPISDCHSLPLLYDMEAAGIYEAAIPYFSCDRLFFVKVVSDALTGLLELPGPQRRARVTDCIAGIMPELTAWLEELADSSIFFQIRGISEDNPLGAEGAILFTEICAALRLSVASSRHLHQLMLYLTLSEIPYLDSMRELLAAPLAAPCRTKKEGLKYLELLSKSYL